ncbi:coiled-coil domain-containing protein [Sesbania bispinosa]|nr:coiled-coil domain-containing protein [Sesbania bispinosa]
MPQFFRQDLILLYRELPISFLKLMVAGLGLQSTCSFILLIIIWMQGEWRVFMVHLTYFHFPINYIKKVAQVKRMKENVATLDKEVKRMKAKMAAREEDLDITTKELLRP